MSRSRSRLRRTPAALLSVALVAASGAVLSGQAAYASNSGVIVGADRPGVVAGSYIVTLSDAVPVSAIKARAAELAKSFGGTVRYTYTASLHGFSVSMSEKAARQLAASPLVKRVEANGTARISGTQDNPPSWGLDRVDQVDLPLDKKYTYPGAASNVTAYILDTGIRFSHQDFGGRAASGYDFIDNDNDASDCHGHGTHVAGSVAGTKYGVAKEASLIGVRVLDCNGSGSYDQIIAGIDWVTENASGPSVANMSLGGNKNQSVNDAVAGSIRAGITYAIAAGNDNGDACNKTPASTPEAITLGATEIDDDRSSYSNYGTCLDLFAPGTDITSAWHDSNTATKTISGTSMATPHAAGGAALLLSAHPTWTPQKVRDQLVADAPAGKVKNPGSGSPNKLMNVTADRPDPGAPQASFTASCSETNTTCTFDGSASSDPDGTISSYAWDFGDGKTGSGAKPSHTYATAGSYTVKLTVTDNDGKTDSAATTANVGPNKAPSASFTQQCYAVAHVCSFNGKGSSDPDGSIAKWSWNFGDGTTGEGAEATHGYSKAGTFTVKLTVTDNRGATATTTRSVNVP